MTHVVIAVKGGGMIDVRHAFWPFTAAVRLTTRHFSLPPNIVRPLSGIRLASIHTPEVISLQGRRGRTSLPIPSPPLRRRLQEKRPQTEQIILCDFLCFWCFLICEDRTFSARTVFETVTHWSDKRRLIRNVKKNNNKTLTNMWLGASIDTLQTIHVREGVFPLLKLTEAFISKAGCFLTRTQIRVISDDKKSQPITFLSQNRYVKIQKQPDCHGICQKCPCHPRVWFIISAQGSAVSVQNTAGLRPCGRTHNNCHFCRNTNDHLFVMASFTYRKLKQCMFLLISAFSLFFFFNLFLFFRITVFGTGAKWLSVLQERNLKPSKHCRTLALWHAY